MKKFIQVLGGVAALCATLLFLSFTVAVVKKVWSPQKDTSKGHVAVVDITGMILSSTSFTKEIERLLENTSTKAIVVRVNSPGGLVAPSQEMYDAIRRADQKVPVVVSMGALAASGGFYAAMGGRKVYASSGTLTGSIGVIMEFMNTSKLYSWAKVERYVLKSGKFKDIGNTARAMTPEERDLLTGMITDIHSQFKDVVKERRKLPEAAVNAIADGRVMTGRQAKEAKLIDTLGGFDDAAKEAKKLAGLNESAPVIFNESKNGLLKRLLVGEDENSNESTSLEQIFGQFQRQITPGFHVMLLAPISN